MKISIVLFTAVLFTACGPSVTVGSSCSTASASECSGAKEVAYCENGTWKGYACPSSCNSTGGDQKCDWKGVTDGDACPHLAVPEYCTADLQWRVCNNLDQWQTVACSRCKADRKYEDVLDCTSFPGRCLCD